MHLYDSLFTCAVTAAHTMLQPTHTLTKPTHKLIHLAAHTISIHHGQIYIVQHAPHSHNYYTSMHNFLTTNKLEHWAQKSGVQSTQIKAAVLVQCIFFQMLLPKCLPRELCLPSWVIGIKVHVGCHECSYRLWPTVAHPQLNYVFL